jgi:hypothetical protein
VICQVFWPPLGLGSTSRADWWTCGDKVIG